MAQAVALTGLPCWDVGLCGVEGWLEGTRVVTGSTFYQESGEGPGEVPGAPPWRPEGLVAGGAPLLAAG